MNKKTGLKAGFVFEKDDVKLLDGYRQVSVSFVCFLFFAFLDCQGDMFNESQESFSCCFGKGFTEIYLCFCNSVFSLEETRNRCFWANVEIREKIF